VDNTAKLFSKWQGWINTELLRQFQEIIVFKRIADGFAASLKPLAGTEAEWGDLVLWMSVNYFASAASAIRRLDDRRTDTISLRRLLEDVKKHAAVVTQENLSAYRGEMKPGEPSISVQEALTYDLRLLSTSGKSIHKFVDKMIAHHADDAHKITVPTYQELNVAIHTFHCIYRKWALVLAGMNCQIKDPNPNDLLPMDSPDYKARFTKMWNALGK
jgi:hypothetical protein